MYGDILSASHMAVGMATYCQYHTAVGMTIYCQYHIWQWSRDSSVGIATRYGLDDPGIESRWGQDFPHSSRAALGHTQPPV